MAGQISQCLVSSTKILNSGSVLNSKSDGMGSSGCKEFIIMILDSPIGVFLRVIWNDSSQADSFLNVDICHQIKSFFRICLCSESDKRFTLRSGSAIIRQLR